MNDSNTGVPDLSDDYEDEKIVNGNAVDTVSGSVFDAQLADFIGNDDETAPARVSPPVLPRESVVKAPVTPVRTPQESVPQASTTVAAVAAAEAAQPLAEVHEDPAAAHVKGLFGGLRLPTSEPQNVAEEAPASPTTAPKEAPATPSYDEQLNAILDDAEEVPQWERARAAWARKNPEAARKDDEKRAARAERGVDKHSPASINGRNNRRKSTNRKRKNLTQTDHEVLYFLGLCGIAYASQVAMIQRNTGFKIGKKMDEQELVERRGVTLSTALTRLKALQRMRLVRRVRLAAGYSPVWYLTEAGAGYLEREGLVGPHDVVPQTAAAAVEGLTKHKLAVAEVLAERIWRHGGGVLPAYTGTTEAAHYVTDARLRGDVQRLRNRLTENTPQGQRKPTLEEVRKAAFDVLKDGNGGEKAIQNPIVFTVFAANPASKATVYPDLVEYRRVGDRLEVTAIEVELTAKMSENDYAEKLAAYLKPYKNMRMKVLYYVTADGIEPLLTASEEYRELAAAGRIEVKHLTDAAGKHLRARDIPGLELRREALAGEAS